MKHLFLLLFLFITVVISAQTHSLKGKLQDEKKLPLVGATAVLLNAKDSLLAHYGVADLNGNFEIKDIPNNKFILQISFLGYENYRKEITFSGEGKTSDLGTLSLKPKEKILNQITIKGKEIPIIMNGDTVEYRAGAFKTQPNADVAALLDKLPGIEIDEDGTIKAHGKTVNKILVDGKEFFGNDPKIATKNLPAEAVETVQVFDKKSDYAEFTGIEDGKDSKTINLSLKKDFKSGIFGNVMAGAGSKNRFDGKINLNKFSKKSRISLIATANNINKQTFSLQDYMQMSGGLAGMMSQGGSVEINVDAGMPGTADFKTGFVESGLVGLNFNKSFSSKSELSGTYFLNAVRQNINQTTERQYFLPNEDFYFENLANDEISKSLNHQVSVNYNLEIDSTQMLRFKTNLGVNTAFFDEVAFNETFDSGNQTQNNSERENSNDGNSFNGTTELSYQKRFGFKGRNMAINLTAGMNEKSAKANLLAQNQFFTDGAVSQIDTISQTQDDANNQFSYGLNISYTEPLGKRKYLTFSASHSNYSNTSSKDVFDLIPIKTQNENLTNDFKRNYLYEKGGVSFKVNRAKYSLTLKGELQRSSLSGKISGAENNIVKKWDYFLPSAFWKYDFKESTDLNFSYQTSIKEPSLEQLQPIVDNRNPLSIYMGNPDLQPEYNHGFSLRFFTFSQFSSTNFITQFNVSLAENNISNSKIIDATFKEIIQPINSGEALRFRNYVSFSTPINFVNSRFRVSVSNSYSKENTFINEQKNSSENINSTLKASINNRNTEKIDIRFGVKLNQNKVKYSLQPSLNKVYLNHSYYAKLSVFPFKNIRLKQNFRYNFFDAGNGSEQKIPLWGAGVSVFFKEKKVELGFSVTDILDKNTRINQQGSSNYLEVQKVNSLGRYFMLSLTYKLRKFGNDDEIHIEKI